MNRPLCIYHANCMDGFASAWVVWRMSAFGEGEFLALNYDDPIPDLTDRDVCIVDYSFNDVEGFVEAAAKAKSIILLDHHKGADKKYAGIKFPEHVELKWDFSKSGVGVAWDYFMPRWPLPNLLQYVQQRDLWHIDIQGVKEVHAYLKALGFMSPTGDILEKFRYFSTEVEGAQLTPQWEKDMIDRGAAVLLAENTLLHSILQRTKTMAEFVEYGPVDGSSDWQALHHHIVPVAEVPYELASEAGNILAEGHPFSITYETQWALGKRKFSIRSHPETGINVMPIAQKMGGSGHEHAAGWYEGIHDELPFRELK